MLLTSNPSKGVGTVGCLVRSLSERRPKRRYYVALREKFYNDGRVARNRALGSYSRRDAMAVSTTRSSGWASGDTFRPDDKEPPATADGTDPVALDVVKGESPAHSLERGLRV